MLPFNILFQHSLFYGAILSALLTALIVGTLYWRPMMWIGDAPKEVQAAAPPPSESDHRAKKLAGVLLFAIIAVVFGASVLGLRRLAGGELGFADAFVSTFIVFMTFNLVDLVLIDWLLVETWRPRFISFPGAEGMNLFGGYAYHFRGFLIGTAVYCLLGSLIIAAIASLIL